MADEAIGYLMNQGLGAYLDLEGPRHKFGSERDEWMSAVDPDNRISLPPDADDDFISRTKALLPGHL